MYKNDYIFFKKILVGKEGRIGVYFVDLLLSILLNNVKFKNNVWFDV